MIPNEIHLQNLDVAGSTSFGTAAAVSFATDATAARVVRVRPAPVHYSVAVGFVLVDLPVFKVRGDAVTADAYAVDFEVSCDGAQESCCCCEGGEEILHGGWWMVAWDAWVKGFEGESRNGLSALKRYERKDAVFYMSLCPSEDSGPHRKRTTYHTDIILCHHDSFGIGRLEQTIGRVSHDYRFVQGSVQYTVGEVES